MTNIEEIKMIKEHIATNIKRINNFMQASAFSEINYNDKIAEIYAINTKLECKILKLRNARIQKLLRK